MQAVVNGQMRELHEGTTVSELLTSLGIDSAGIAVACNERVVRRSEYARRRIDEGDRVEIIKAVAGG